MGKLEDMLVKTLYRSACPDSMMLGEFQLGILPPEQVEIIQRHLRFCPHCTSELEGLKDFQNQLAHSLEASPIERFKTWIAQRLPNLPDALAGGQLAPAFALRGEAGQLLAYQAGEAQLSLTVQEDPEQPDRRSVLGLLIGAPPEDVRVSLFHHERISSQGQVDELGNFVISGIKPGEYELALRGKGFEIYVAPLQIE